MSFTSKLINVDNTLRVNGDTRFDEVTLVNRGTVEASIPDSNFELDFPFGKNSGDLTNSGVIRAIDGAKLAIALFNNFAIQNYEIDEQGNTLAGTIQAGAGSEVLLEDVIGGILQADEGGVIRILNDGSINVPISPFEGLPAVEMQLLGRVEAAGNLTIAGIIRNDGHFEAGTVDGRGRVRLLGNGVMYGGVDMSGLTAFFNGPEHTIMGSGVTRLYDNLFVNEGRIETSSGQFTIDTSSLSNAQLYFRHHGELISSGSSTLKMGELFNWSNEALIESRDHSRLEISFRERFTNQGIIRITEDALAIFTGNQSTRADNQFVNGAGAEIEIEGRLLIRDGILVNEAGGTITGGGSLEMLSGPPEDRRFFNHGTLTLGNSVGQFRLFGNFEQTITGDLEIELGGSSPEKYDSLFVWSAVLAGQLEVSLADLGEGEFEPALGDTFTIIELFNGPGEELLTGEFDTFLLPTLAVNLAWSIQYNPTSVVLEILAPLQADLDFDGDVDGSDFLMIQRTNPALIPLWKAQYGSSTAMANSQAVPEPSNAVFLLLAVVLWQIAAGRLEFRV